PHAPATLLIDKLHTIRNRLFPPPKLGPWLDLGRVRRWLDHCNVHHIAHCQLSPQSEQLFNHLPRRLIDVQRRCLVPAKPSRRYAALSYVWGITPSFKTLRRNIDRLQQDGALDIEAWAQGARGESGVGQPLFPSTIRDAMELTRQLGEGLLWVDALCIVQDDDEDRQHQLSRMGSIYANAYVTIVAANGTALDGLRGIEGATLPIARPVPAAPYYLFHRRGNYLHEAIQSAHRQLRESVWSQRGWTFQEQIFSRRLLILDHNSVTWECHCAVWLEGMEPAEGQCQDNRAMAAQGFSFSAQPNLGDYARHVAQFNRRQLTYPEDALDAFTGILAILSSTAFTDGFICGLPVLFFDVALLWYNKAPLERRCARRQRDRDNDATGVDTHVLPPSWAWAAWGGAVEYADLDLGLDGASRGTEEKPLARWGYQRSLVGWKYRTRNKEDWKPVTSFFAERRLSSSHGEPAETVSSTTGGKHTNGAEGNSNETKGAESGIPAVLNGTHMLLAYPLRAFFHVKETFGQVTVLLTDGSARGCAGSLTSSGKPSNKTDLQPHPPCEVVAVSVSSLNGEEAYDVLWIGWKGGIAYRRGVGRIRKPAWEAQNAERIELILG
ncbi:HET-domain-containing protein, partial [Parachaetomium inaequale]